MNNVTSISDTIVGCYRKSSRLHDFSCSIKRLAEKSLETDDEWNTTCKSALGDLPIVFTEL